MRYDPEHETDLRRVRRRRPRRARCLERERSGEVPLEAHPESFQREVVGAHLRQRGAAGAGRGRGRREEGGHRVDGGWTGPAPTTPWPSTKRITVSSWARGGHRGCSCSTPQPGRSWRPSRPTATSTTSSTTQSRRRVYVIGGDGSVVVYGQTDPDHYPERARVRTADGARTGLFVPELGPALRRRPAPDEPRRRDSVFDRRAVTEPRERRASSRAARRPARCWGSSG